ncbi:MAG TPA: hypothetical protein VLW50_12805 [Streptosporangiaceae bacterium]|nr:hypothetical protein [Streptosporangiaceae bacterium]
MTGRGSRVRFDGAGGHADPVPVPQFGPVVFSLTFGGAEKTADFSDLACPLLARPLAAALASIGGDTGTIRTWSPGFAQRVMHLRTFVTFAAGVLGTEAGLADVTPGLLDDFEAALSRRFGAGAGPVGVYLATVVRLLRIAAQGESSALPAGLQARLGYAASERCVPSAPLDAYPLPVLAAMKEAALADVRSITARLDAGRALASAGQDPQTAGWLDRQNVLWGIREHGPLTAGRMRELGWHGNRHGGARDLNNDLFLGVNDLVPFLVALLCLTGLEPECAKGLRGDCLSSPSGGFWTLAYDKPRAHIGTGKTMRVRGGGTATPAGLIQLAVRLTQPAREAAGSTALWVGAGDDGLRAFFDDTHQMNTQVRAWMDRHRLDQLTDYGGGRVRLDLRRLRKTVKSGKYLAAGGVLDDFTAGHSRQVAASRYADIGAHREIHDRAVEAGLEQALAVALPPPAVIPDGAGLPGVLSPAQLRAARSDDNDVFLASCASFHDSPFARKPGGPCPVAVWGCLECPNAVFTDRHLPSLVAFAGFLEDQREALGAAEWTARYGLAWQRLNDGVFPVFPPGRLEAARASAAADDTAALPARLLEQLT